LEEGKEKELSKACEEQEEVKRKGKGEPHTHIVWRER
jgi:hypothetical protein